ncbi:bis(5'-nucleosyl)-tetraphosphatase (symmetrical) YqeK [Dorea acetigenes]|jgi:predicted HD superfamily hydrolase involved in NAD metabolism|uniref:bis(5'-nucleosyl)-tetraphosphatase (symmetrical) n=1 Tax=Dorea acetigenes TaxID=2981787 RepID=A0ABT2RJ95_9FIRM|nr:bis(5'-nucleosyl)-tetraphosphatase (symmetrical) YqeK [Dorea acetigenes]MCB6413800.1 bis(5'-nucleosyl)-tetraphosphatase (symmetrical) YqeK [Faecalimonas umbilicata]MCU6685475.1 bis(5'-nucleosyl)-tetraphosphatase (symmetrical) YqeK [Dorea acetigenes]SCI53013.1 putative nicotinate-nucleotide adenylyltransferase [uncultured Clostridium sp.]
MNEQIKRMQQKLKKHLDEDRYEHTLGVMYTAGALAMRYQENIRSALIAGLLHDCAKCIPTNKKFKMCSKYHLEVSETERSNPSLLHAKLGAYLAEKKYHVRDEAILSAITFHTTGKPAMSLLEKIVYVADYIEPGRRELPNMAEIRRLAFENIDECIYQILQDSLNYLNTRNITVDPMTEKTYLYYKAYLKKEEV